LSSTPRLSSTHMRILELLRERGSMTVDELAKLLGVKPSTVRKYALELEKLGYVERRGRVVLQTALRGGGKQAVVPFFFVNPSKGAVTLQISTLRQLAAALAYELVDDESLSYAVQSGYLAAWLRSVGEEEAARLVEEAHGGDTAELRQRLAAALRAHLV